MKEALRYSAALLGELRTSLLRWAHTPLLCGPTTPPPRAHCLHDRMGFVDRSGRLWHGVTLPPGCLAVRCDHRAFCNPFSCVAAARRSTTSCTCRRATSCATWRWGATGGRKRAALPLLLPLLPRCLCCCCCCCFGACAAVPPPLRAAQRLLLTLLSACLLCVCCRYISGRSRPRGGHMPTCTTWCRCLCKGAAHSGAVQCVRCLRYDGWCLRPLVPTPAGAPTPTRVWSGWLCSCAAQPYNVPAPHNWACLPACSRPLLTARRQHCAPPLPAVHG